MIRSSALPVAARQAGFSMIEVLVAVVVIALGLLGLAGLQTKMLGVEMEAYQRSTALMVLENMANTIRANEDDARDKGIYDAIDCPDVTEPIDEICAWINTMTTNTEGQDIGGLIGVRGCVEALPGALKTLRVSVAWQGLTPTAAPPDDLVCGVDEYGDETLRRVISTVVVILNPEDPG